MPETVKLPEIDYAFQENFLLDLLKTPSPTGHAEQAIHLLEETLKAFPEVKTSRSRKGALLAVLPGREPTLKRGQPLYQPEWHQFRIG